VNAPSKTMPAVGAGDSGALQDSLYTEKNISQKAYDFKPYALHDVFMHLEAGTIKTARFLVPLLDDTEYEANREEIAARAGIELPELDAIYGKATQNVNISRHVVNAEIAKTREKLHLAPDEWQHFAIFNARLALDSASDSVRALFVGKPSQTPRNVLLLAEIFTVLMMRAENAAQATALSYLYAFLWDEATTLWEAQHA